MARNEAMNEDFVGQTLARQKVADAAMHTGDPEPFIAMWSTGEPVSLFGAFGPCKTGPDELARTFRWVGGRFSAGESMRTDLEVAHVGTDLAYTVGYEHGEMSTDGAPVAPVRIRVTQIYRLENGAWKLVHRHGDFAPPDQSAPTTPPDL